MEENLKTIFNSLYYINQNGVVFDSDLKIMKQQMTFDGYPVISLRMNDGSRKTHRVHRLVAVAFIENPELKKYPLLKARLREKAGEFHFE